MKLFSEVSGDSDSYSLKSVLYSKINFTLSGIKVSTSHGSTTVIKSNGVIERLSILCGICVFVDKPTIDSKDKLFEVIY